MSTIQPEFTMSQYAAMRARIAELEARVQELGQMARDVNSRRVVELEAQLASIGAGGVSALMGAANAGSEPVAWPKNAAEVRDFFSSDFISAEFAAPDQSPCDEDRYYISAHDFLSAINWWADFPHHPSPPEGMAGWISVDERLPKCSRKPDSLGVEVLIWPPHEDGSRTAFYGRRQSTNPNFYKYGALLNHVQFWAEMPAPPLASEAKGASE